MAKTNQENGMNNLRSKYKEDERETKPRLTKEQKDKLKMERKVKFALWLEEIRKIEEEKAQWRADNKVNYKNYEL